MLFIIDWINNFFFTLTDIYIKIINMENIESKLDDFLKNEKKENNTINTKEDFLEIKEKDGIIERINKKIIVEDGRTILMD